MVLSTWVAVHGLHHSESWPTLVVFLWYRLPCVMVADEHQVEPSGDYSSAPRPVSMSDKISFAGGINRPKVVSVFTCALLCLWLCLLLTADIPAVWCCLLFAYADTARRFHMICVF
jgi:hypothetical protein